MVKIGCGAAAALAFSSVLFSVFVSVPAPSNAQVRLLSKGQTLRGTVTGDGTAEIHLDVHEGDFVLGRLQTSSTDTIGDLVGEDGRHIRRLIEEGSTDQQFMFIGPPGNAYLRLKARSGAQEYTLTLEQVTPLAAQIAPRPPFLSKRIAKLAEHLAKGGSSDAFWAAAKAEGTPLIEPGATSHSYVVTFLWRGAEHNVRLFGGPSNDHDWMYRLGSSDVWYRSYEVPASTRLAYKLAPDIPDLPGTEYERRRALLATAQSDPLNKRPWPEDAPDRYNQESVLELPEAPVEPWLAKRDGPKGVLQRHDFASKILGNSRDVYLYTSPGHEPGNANQALLVLFDAAPYLNKVPTPTILDNLVADGKIPPLVAVLVGNPNRDARSRELACNSDFARFLVGELIPWVAERTGARATSQRTVVAGSSYGGLASACAAQTHPETFGNVLSMSGSFWWSPAENEPEWLTRKFASNAAQPTRFFLSAGTFEMGRDGPGILDTTRHLRDVLIAKGMPVIYREYAATHDYIAWRTALADGLTALLRPR